MIDCNKAREFSNAYIDGELDEESACLYEEHISCCEVCHDEYDMLKRISAELPLTAASVPDGFARRVHTALVNEQFKKEKSRKVFAFPYYKSASVMAAALVIAVVGKYGIYDTYKNVTGETSRIATEMTGKVSEALIDVPEIEVSEEKEIKNIKPEHIYTTKTVVEQEPVVEEIQVTQTEEDAPIVDIAPVAETVTPDVPVYTPEVEQTEVAEKSVAEEVPTTDNAAMLRMAEPTSSAEVTEVNEEAQTETVTDELASGGGSDAAFEPKELIPAQVIIYNNGDAAMMMFKKFLLTILNSSQITDNNGEITVNINADEYESVMQHIRANEYVKTVTEGTPFDGKAIINIK